MMRGFRTVFTRPVCCLSAGALLALPSLQLSAHDTFLRPDSYRPDSGEALVLWVFNGSYNESVDSIRPGEIAEIKHAGPEGTTVHDAGQWRRTDAGSKAWRASQLLQANLGGMDNRRTSSFPVHLVEPGTHVIGLTLHPLRAAMSPQNFLIYMGECGLEDEAIAQLEDTDPNRIIRERYVKAAKAIVDTGEGGGDPTQPLGLPVEIVPLRNPAGLKAGDDLPFVALVEGKPVADQVVLAGRRQGLLKRGAHDHVRLRTDAFGQFSLELSDSGEWWVKFNHIISAPEDDPMDIITHWATLSFNIQ
jgi:hypothetical protein